MTAEQARKVSMAARSKFMWERVREAAEAGHNETMVPFLTVSMDDVDLLVSELVNMGYSVNGQPFASNLYQLFISW